MSPSPSKDPLHGVTLERMLKEMVEVFGWDGLARDLPISCFTNQPSMTSALKYLRKAPRARKQVEDIYLEFSKRAGR